MMKILARPTDILDSKLDGLLIDWHNWRGGYSLSKGYSSADSTCRDHQAPTHWDWWNGAADARSEELTVKAVDVAIQSIPNTPQPWNTAIQMEARNLAGGASVWSSARLPQEREEREVLRLEARNMLARRLRNDGVLT